MPQPEWEAMERQLHDLTERVARLEEHTGWNAPAHAQPRPQLVPEHPLAEVPNLLPVAGRALLGLAGAYLLRALTEGAILAPTIGVAIGAVYAICWLASAAHRPKIQTLSAAIDGLTAAAVLCPLLWEAVMRFHCISAWTAAGMLLLFSVAGTLAPWRGHAPIVSTIATLAALGTGAVLLVATQDVLPFTFQFLGVVVAMETAACLEHRLSERWPAAAVADLAVLLATWLVTNERGVPPGYMPIPQAWLLTAQLALLATYLLSTIVRTILHGHPITVFETIQCGAAFVISLNGGLRMAPALAAGVVICAAACYLASFALLERRDAPSRNFYTYSTFAILLALAGSRILLSGTAVTLAWSALALGCLWIGGRFSRLTLQMHGAIYLLLALIASGALRQAGTLLLGLPAAGIQTAIWTGLAASAASYGLVAIYHSEGRSWNAQQVCRTAIAAIFVWLAAASTAGLLTSLYHSVFGANAPHAYCATMCTGVLALLALVLAWIGPRWNRYELSRLAYPAILLGGYRLLTQDLHQDHKIAPFLSLLMLGTVLTALPRLRRG